MPTKKRATNKEIKEVMRYFLHVLDLEQEGVFPLPFPLPSFVPFLEGHFIVVKDLKDEIGKILDGLEDYKLYLCKSGIAYTFTSWDDYFVDYDVFPSYKKACTYYEENMKQSLGELLKGMKA